MTVNHLTRQMLQSDKWEWRHHTYTDAEEHHAAAILRDQYSRAAKWLQATSILAGMPLPVGNGTNGSWNRIACITPSCRLGIVDIAAGRAVEYDAQCPSYVRRFATSVKDATSPNQAGGCGGIPRGWLQAPIIIGGGTVVRVVAPVCVSPVIIIWGLHDCYGGIGTCPTADDWREDWSQYVGLCPVVETADPQQEEIDFGSGVDPALWQEFRKTWGYSSGFNQSVVTTSGAHMQSRHYVYVYGSRDQRAVWIPAIRAAWTSFICERAIQAVFATWSRSGLPLPSSPGGKVAGRWPHEHSVDRDSYTSWSLIDAVRPAHPLNAEQRAEIQRTADIMLSADPQSVVAEIIAHAATYRGCPVTAARNLDCAAVAAGVETDLYRRLGVNNAYSHVVELPGVNEWHHQIMAMVDAAKQAAK